MQLDDMAAKSEKSERILPAKHNPLMVGDVIPECTHPLTPIATRPQTD
jgi:hypothetical protein